MDDAILDAPKARVAVPAIEVLAIEELAHAGRLGRGRVVGGGGGEGEEGDEGEWQVAHEGLLQRCRRLCFSGRDYAWAVWKKELAARRDGCAGSGTGSLSALNTP